MGKIVWLASYPKSGNTWMRAFIHHLFRNPDQPIPLNQLGGGNLTTSETGLDWYRALDPREPAQWSAQEIAVMRLKVQAAIAASVPGNIFCKVHSAIFKRGDLKTVNLEVSVGAIYIVRNPLDVALSFADYQGVSVDVAIRALGTPNFELPRVGDAITSPLGSWSQNVRSWSGHPNPALHVVRYEDMLANPVTAFGGVVRFLGMDVGPERLEKVIGQCSFDVLRGQEDRTGFVERSPAQERFFRKGQAGQWREELKPDQVARIVEDHRDEMARFGYLPEGLGA
jgi:hypothetical protein